MNRTIPIHSMIFDKLKRDLAMPLHAQTILDTKRHAMIGSEADLAQGYTLRIEDRFSAQQLESSSNDFEHFLSYCLGVCPRLDSYLISATIGKPSGCPAGTSEAFHIHIAETICTITASDTDGIRRALVWLEDEMQIRRAPVLPLTSISRWAVIKDRITRSPLAPYRWLTGWELEQETVDYYPDEYLNKLMHCGMNGIWVAGLLSRMIATKSLPKIGPKVHQLGSLKRLVDKTSRYGIKVYLFCIEPRTMPPDHPVFKVHPEIQGAFERSLCVSTPLVQQYIREVMRELFTEVPDLAGIINIFNGERPTSCWSWWGAEGAEKKIAATCPRCRKRAQSEVLADSLNCFMEGIRQASHTAKLIAWDYGIPRSPEYKEALPYTVHPEVIWMDNFEHNGEKIVNDKIVEVHEYSLSSVGPSDYFAGVARKVVGQGRHIYAKLQVGNTYELSTVPYIPVPHIAYDKLAESQRHGVSGTMLSWIIGGYPSMMLKAAGEACFSPLKPRDQELQRIAAIDWGPAKAETIAEAWNLFSEVFKQYLCAIEVFYFGPITRCPSYQLHLENETALSLPYNWGITRERDIQPYEDKIERWTGPFIPEELVESFRRMGNQWSKGVTILYDCLKGNFNISHLKKQYAVAAAIRLQLLSAANVIEFYMLRERLKKVPAAEQHELVKRLREIVEKDINLAREMKLHVAADPFIGFQSEIYGYSYNKRLLDEKISHDATTLETLIRWEKYGMELDVLNAVLPVQPMAQQPAEESALDPDWLCWGD